MEINLSGQGGLSPKYYGDTDGKQRPNLRFKAGEGQMVQGYFNPMKVSGYLSPANKTLNPLTPPENMKLIGSTLYNTIEKKAYFGERGNRILESELGDTNFEELLSIEKETSQNVTITDMEIYELNGARRLFYSYNRIDADDDSKTQGDVGYYSLEESFVYNIPQGNQSEGTDADAYRFAQFLNPVERIRFDTVRTFLRFDGTNDDFNLVCRIRPHGQFDVDKFNNFGPRNSILFESETIPASSLSTTSHEQIEFKFSENVDIENNQRIWFSIEPENLGTFSTPANDWSISVADTADRIFTEAEMRYNDDSTSFSSWSSFAPLITDSQVGPVAIGSTAQNYYEFQVFTGDGLPTRGDITLKFSLDNVDASNWFVEVRVDGVTLLADDVTATPALSFGTVDWEGVQGHFEVIIHKPIDAGSDIQIRGQAVDGTVNLEGVELEYVDHIDARDMSIIAPQLQSEDKWLSEIVENNFNLDVAETKFVLADNGFMYILNDHAVHQVSGARTDPVFGNVTSNLLTFPEFFEIRDGVDWRGNMLIAINHREIKEGNKDNFNGQCGVYIWDRLSTTIRMRDYIAIPGTREIRSIYITPDNQVRAITISSNGITEIREFTGNSFETIKEVGFDAYPRFKDSLKTAGNMTYWLGVDGKFYSHGKFEPGGDEGLFILNEIEKINEDEIIDTGAIMFGSPLGLENAGNDGFYLSVDVGFV